LEELLVIEWLFWWSFFEIIWFIIKK
jgi:hypothetical protein